MTGLSVELHECVGIAERYEIGFVPRYTVSPKGLVELRAMIVYENGDMGWIPLPVFTEWWEEY